MLFNSITYLIFLPAVYLAYRFSPDRYRNVLLLIASYTFYAWWDIRFLFLIIVSTVVNYCCGLMIKNGKIGMKERANASAWLVLSCLLFIVSFWNHSRGLGAGLLKSFDWTGAMSWSGGWTIFFVVCALILLSHVLYPLFVKISEEKRRPLFLVAGVSANLLVLGFFKYFNFFIENIEWLLGGLGVDPGRFYLNIILPIGISFYTFKGIGYVMDVYRGEFEPEHHYRDFALFIAFFPALLAGPIDRAGGLLRQISAHRELTIEQTLRGLHLIFYGLFKKIVIADGVVRTVNSVYGSAGKLSWIDVVVATVLFTIQIYCDFSGYTDMARGTAKLFGFDLMANFNLPYFSQNPREFWSRWHISLSTWLRDYLYIPLGGNRRGRGKTYWNLLLTMALGGLWHGAAWNFVIWGLYHGLLLCVHRAVGAAKWAIGSQANLANGVIKTACFFCLTCYGWLIFRSPSLEKVITLSSILVGDFGNLDFGATRPRFGALLGLPILLCIEGIERATESKSFYKSLPTPVWTAIYASMIFAFVVGLSTEATQFIYFNF
jgi:alginate O-acetyltransferase complex protein AlgI